MPMPLSSHSHRIGAGRPRRAAKRPALSPDWAVAWLVEASPKEQQTIADRGTPGSIPIRRARPMAKAVPMAFGRCEAMVLVCGGTQPALEPHTLWRPPETGSSREAHTPCIMSSAGSPWPSRRARAIISPPER